MAVDDPPPAPGVTPDPADPPPDKLLLNTGIVGAVSGLVFLLMLRHLWKRRQRRRAQRSAGSLE